MTIPSTFQALYAALETYLTNFTATLKARWDGTKYPTAYAACLWSAGADAGPNLVNPGYMAGLLLQLNELKAIGVQAIVVEVGFPMLYEPFFASTAQYQQFVTFYQSVAAAVRSAGLKLIVDNETLRNSTVTGTFSGWDTAAFYASLTWDQYQAARAQTAATIAATMQPDWLMVLNEPDTEAAMSGQAAVNTATGASGMLAAIVAQLKLSGSTVKIGAGVGTWLTGYSLFIAAFLMCNIDFIDIHILPVNLTFLPNALAIALMAQAAGKPVTATQTWLRKVADSELTTVPSDVIEARNPFSFWEPLDQQFIQLMALLANTIRMPFLCLFETLYWWAYLAYSMTSSLTPPQITAQESTESYANLSGASFTAPAHTLHDMLVTDTLAPSAPTNLAGSSHDPTKVYLTWSASEDNVGVAGYSVFRDGTKIGKTAQTFYMDTGLTDASTHTYNVEAFDLAGNSLAETPFIIVTTWNTIAPSAPIGLSLVYNSCTEATLSWTPSTGKVAIGSYRVFLNGFEYRVVYGPPLVFYALTPGAFYGLTVEAVDVDGNVSAMSAQLEIEMPALPMAPTALAASVQNGGKLVQLIWKPGASTLPVIYYAVYRGTSSGSLAQIALMSKPSFADYPVVPKTKYWYAVKEVSQGGNFSALSAALEVQT